MSQPHVPETKLKSLGNKLYSTVNCEAAEHTCLITNLYLLKTREAHVYLPPDLGGLNLTWLLNDVTVYTGIGSGGYYIRPWHIQTMGPWPYGIPAGVTKTPSNSKDGAEQEESQFFIPLYVHLASEEQPPLASNSLPYRTQPLMVFSVLWQNLFRTLYAGAFYLLTVAIFVTHSLRHWSILHSGPVQTLLSGSRPDCAP
jgi:hypothetical protein